MIVCLSHYVSRYKTYMEVSHLRPVVPISKAPYLWWQYAAQAVLQKQQKWCLGWFGKAPDKFTQDKDSHHIGMIFLHKKNR